MSTEPDIADQLPPLPAPENDGAASRIPRGALPPVSLIATTGEAVGIDQLGSGRTIIYVYPLTGRDDIVLPEGWRTIPGAAGCTAQACSFRDRHQELLAHGITRVFGLSSQTTDYQREAVQRLHLPFSMLADPDLLLAESLNLPTFEVEQKRLYRRLTLVITNGRIDHIFYPVFPPAEHADQVLSWAAENPPIRSDARADEQPSRSTSTHND
ncbi:peroxiredoxin [Nocardia sp. NPDC056541]|uniref:peroxiredoxin n=1 Tax=Nocardia sp. NPDC056541 TaxID=3345860 RepID=UPI003672A458